jgi:phosphohistidine phosphatase
MKTLYIVRHAKSSWDDPGLADFDRPLNERGKKDAPRMGKRLKKKDVHPQLMLSSPAKRAYSTSKKIAEVLGYEATNIKTDEDLYHAEPGVILSVLKRISDNVSVVVVFGHNPGFTEFVNELGTDTDIDNIPTCGVVAFSLPIDSWKEIRFKSGKQLFFDYPKSKED